MFCKQKQLGKLHTGTAKAVHGAYWVCGESPEDREKGNGGDV